MQQQEEVYIFVVHCDGCVVWSSVEMVLLLIIRRGGVKKRENYQQQLVQVYYLNSSCGLQACAITACSACSLVCGLQLKERSISSLGDRPTLLSSSFSCSLAPHFSVSSLFVKYPPSRLLLLLFSLTVAWLRALSLH